MKLQDIRTWVTVPPTGIGGSFWVIVKVTTDDGIEGIGECYGIPFSGDVACRMVEDTFERYIAGEDPHDVETLFRRVYSAGFTTRCGSKSRVLRISGDPVPARVLRGLHDPLWFEEPCPPDQMDAIGKVARATSIPVATGERLAAKVEFHQVLKAGVSILQPDVGRSGGIWETRKIAVIAELYNAQIAPHIYCGPIAHAAAAHVSFASPNFLILETIRSGFHDAILSKRLRWEQGCLIAPTEPGLGIELDELVVREHPYTTGGRLHLDMCQTPLGSNNTKTITELDG